MAGIYVGFYTKRWETRSIHCYTCKRGSAIATYSKNQAKQRLPFISHHLASCCKGFKRSWKFVVYSEVPKHEHSLRSTFLIIEKFATFPGEISNVNSKGVPALHAYRSFSFLLAKSRKAQTFCVLPDYTHTACFTFCVENLAHRHTCRVCVLLSLHCTHKQLWRVQSHM